MRTKLVMTIAAGAVGLSGLAVAVPALAATGTGTASPTSGTSATSRVDQLKKALAGLVSDGTINQAQADKVATTLAQADLGPGGPDGRGGPGRHGGFGPGAGLATAAKALGLTEAELRSALEGGKTLAQVAADRKVSVDTLVTALVDAAKARIAQDVKDGRITQDQADRQLADLTARITERVNATRPAPGEGRGGRGGPGTGWGPGTPGEPSVPTPSSGS